MTTRQNLIDRFPEFEASHQGQVTKLLQDLDVEMNSGAAFGSSAERAVCLMAAHRLTMHSIGRAHAAGPVISESETRVEQGVSRSRSVAYAAPIDPKVELTFTSYGRELIRLMEGNEDLIAATCT